MSSKIFSIVMCNFSEKLILLHVNIKYIKIISNIYTEKTNIQHRFFA